MENHSDSSRGAMGLSLAQSTRIETKLSHQPLSKLNSKILQTSFNLVMSRWFQLLGLMQYSTSFMAPYWKAAKYFSQMEGQVANGGSSWDRAGDFFELLLFEMQLAALGTMSGVKAMSQYHSKEMARALAAMVSLFRDGRADDLVGFSERQLELMETVAEAYPRAIREIESEYGFHFDNGGYAKIAETDRFELYQVFPTESNVEVDLGGKPVLIIPPYVLGANILAFLPGENRSYVHAFANQGIPTYIRIVKNIDSTPAVQLMTGEDDARDTRYFSELLVSRHGKQVTLNGYCQGGFLGLISILAGELDGLVDALITNAAPVDGSSSKSLVEYIDHLPIRFRDLGYALKALPNGNRVVDGKLISWVFKLKSIEREAPVPSYYRDLMMFDNGGGRVSKISKTAAAVSHWLTYDRTDLPVHITRLSFDSYTRPIEEDGTLPVRLFGRPLNLKRLQERGVKWLICIAEQDDLTDEGATLAALKYTDAELTVFPKGHASMATNWSDPATPTSLDKYFELKSARHGGRYRGPVRFQLDLDQEYEMDEAA